MSTTFGHIQIYSNFVFFKRKHVYAMVVHNPIKEGHVLVCPIAQKARYQDLDMQELFEISLSIQYITKFLQRFHGCDSATVSIQEGAEAGQTINHLHVHIIPRKAGDFKNNDEIYPILEKFDSDFVEKLQIMDRSSFAATAERYKKEIDKDFPDGKFIQSL